MGIKVFISLLVLSMFSPLSNAAAFTELSDRELDEITAGAVSIEIEDDLIRFEFLSARKNGRSFDGSGSLSLRKDGIPTSLGELVIQDSAQSNLRALVNISAVNSPIQVLLNLNVNINSSVGTVRQINISGELP